MSIINIQNPIVRRLVLVATIPFITVAAIFWCAFVAACDTFNDSMHAAVGCWRGRR